MYFLLYLLIPLIQTIKDDKISPGYGEMSEVDSESENEYEYGGYQIIK